MMPVMNDPNLGKKNIRPKILDAAADLLASKTLSLTEIMGKMASLPDDPIQQKKFVENMLNTLTQAQTMVLEHHKNAPPEPEGQGEWSKDTHGTHLDALMQHYGQK